MCPDTPFSRETTRLMSWPDGVRYLRLPQSLVVSLLLPTFVLSRTGAVLSHRSSLTHRFPRFPPRNLCFLVMLAVSSFVLAATDTSLLLNSSLSRIDRIENPSCSTCGHLSSHSALSSYGLFSTSGELPGFWGSMVFRHAPIPWKGSGKQQQKEEKCVKCLNKELLMALSNKLYLLKSCFYQKQFINIS